MSSYHINPASGDPSICRAHKGNCPFGTSDKHYASVEEARSAFERTMASLTVPAVSKKATQSFDDWGKAREAAQALTVAQRAQQAPAATHSGAHIPNNGDGSITVPPGVYRHVSLDMLAIDRGDDAWASWEAQAYAEYMPGSIRGAYYEGEPMYFLPAPDIGSNHGYDGEVLMAEGAYERLRRRGFGLEDAEQDGAVARVEVGTGGARLFGSLGDYAELPKGFTDRLDDYDDEEVARAFEVYGEESRAGSVFNHPAVRVEA